MNRVNSPCPVSFSGVMLRIGNVREFTRFESLGSLLASVTQSGTQCCDLRFQLIVRCFMGRKYRCISLESAPCERFRASCGEVGRRTAKVSHFLHGRLAGAALRPHPTSAARARLPIIPFFAVFPCVEVERSRCSLRDAQISAVRFASCSLAIAASERRPSSSPIRCVRALLRTSVGVLISHYQTNGFPEGPPPRVMEPFSTDIVRHDAVWRLTIEDTDGSRPLGS